MNRNSIDAKGFLWIAMTQIICKKPKTIKAKITRFRDFFKITPAECATVYEGIAPFLRAIPELSYKLIYLLYKSHFLYRYPVERVMAVNMKTSRDTIRRVVWPTIICMARWCDSKLASKSYSQSAGFISEK